MAIVNKPSDHFNTVLYTGTGSTQSITGVGFQPDLAWFKSRTNVDSHNLVDSVRGAFRLRSDSTSAEVSTTVTLDSDGFTLGGESENNGGSMVAWSWRGSDSSAVSNTDGTITSTVSANTTSGFSIVSYTGTGAVGTIGHGLGQLPAMIIFKNRSSATDWMVFHKNSQSSYSFSATAFLTLNLTSAVNGTGVGGVMNDTAPTTSLFTVGNDSRSNGSGNSMIAYCFAEVKGYSKFGSYTGNGSADGTFVYTGFKPAFVMVKRTDTSGNWWIHDSGRNTYNVLNKYLFADSSSAEGTDDNMDFLSNGFKLRVATYQPNTSGGTWIYLAIAEQPFVTSTTNGSIPATAR
jgi:hypothetical protein